MSKLPFLSGSLPFARVLPRKFAVAVAAAGFGFAAAFPLQKRGFQRPSMADAERFVADPLYEYAAPHFYDFNRDETPEEARAAERWFRTASGYAISPLVAKMSALRPGSGNIGNRPQEMDVVQPNGKSSAAKRNNVASSSEEKNPTEASEIDVTTPAPPQINRNENGTTKGVYHFTFAVPTQSFMQKKAAAMAKRMEHTKLRSTKEMTIMKAIQAEKAAAQEHQAIKKQKLDKGCLRKVLDKKEQVLHHKLPLKASALKNISKPADSHGPRAQDDKMCTTSKVRKFVSKVPDRPILYEKPKLTVPKEPDLLTAHRARPAKVKSTEELEQEMLAKAPKFKALKLNKKILEAPSLPPPSKTAIQFPVFQEFHLKTTERALHHVGTSSLSSNDSMNAEKQFGKPPPSCGLTEPKMPHLETALRARPPKVKSSEELLQEELEKVPKFKARPFNKRIFSSRGDIGIVRNPKRQLTTPVGFYFATDERNQHTDVDRLFEKLTLNSEPHDATVPKTTVPKPFHLLTEERGADKERKFRMELYQLEEKEQDARIPKANPLPCSTDKPLIPPKPHPKECTKPEPFQLQSLIRHEEEQQRLMDELAKAEREEAARRKFRAQPILSIVPDPVPEVPRMPLTEVQEFVFRVDNRAIEREEFDRKIQEKQEKYQKLKEEQEALKREEEEKAIRLMRKQMVPHELPMPDFTSPFVPERSTKEPTHPKSPRFFLPHRQHTTCLDHSPHP